MTDQAVHLGLAGDMSTDSFILALFGFKARRGHPKSIRSDNGSNFIGAERELRDALSKRNQKKIINDFLFLSGFSFTNIHESQDCRGRGRAFL